jgi:hypothetical protein
MPGMWALAGAGGNASLAQETSGGAIPLVPGEVFGAALFEGRLHTDPGSREEGLPPGRVHLSQRGQLYHVSLQAHELGYPDAGVRSSLRTPATTTLTGARGGRCGGRGGWLPLSPRRGETSATPSSAW